jgi:hypothetical protein
MLFNTDEVNIWSHQTSRFVGEYNPKTREEGILVIEETIIITGMMTSKL